MDVLYSVIKCEEGWASLYRPIIKDIIEYDTKQTDVCNKIGVLKIHNELGMLKIECYHPENIPQELSKKIELAKKKSLYMCELCGTTQHVGYIYQTKECMTCCDRCFNSFIKPTLEPSAKWMERIKKYD